MRPFFALALLLGGVGGAWAYQGSATPSGRQISWQEDRISYALNREGSEDVPFKQVEQAVQASFNAWAEPACSPLSFNYRGVSDSRFVGYNLEGKNENLVLWQDDDWSYEDGIIGVTTVTFCTQRAGLCTYEGRILDADIEMNGAEFTFSTNRERHFFDIANALTHEVGHFLGLDHSRSAKATMYPSAPPGETSKRLLSQDDINGLCAIYGDGSAGRAGGDDDGGCRSAAVGAQSPRSLWGWALLIAGMGWVRRRRGAAARA